MRKIFTCVVALLFTLLVNGAGKLSPYTMYFLNEMQTPNTTSNYSKSLLKNVNGTESVEMLIEIADEAVIPQLEAEGVVVGIQTKNIITATVPVNKIVKLADIDGVKYIEIATMFRLLNDKARSSTSVDIVQAGTELPKAYNGEGVIYGSFDTGMDFNHEAFMNDDGTSRILYAYLPNSEDGNKVTGRVYDNLGNITEGGTFPGSEFDSSKISTLTTDNTSDTHGTHTMGDGAGGYMGNVYYAPAPKANIISCASPNTNSVNILNTVSYVFGKAEKLNQPAVMCLSLGTNSGAHDGSGLFESLLDKLTGPGKIVVVSAGNEGNDNIHVGKNLTTPDTELKFILANSYGSFSAFPTADFCNFDVWSIKDNDYTLRIIVYDMATQSILYTSSGLSTSDFSLVLDNSTSGFNSYFDGGVYLYALNRNDRYNVTGIVKGNTLKSDYRLGVLITSAYGARVDAYANNMLFGDEKINGFTQGNSKKSINTMATGQNTISVGAYCSRNVGPSILGGNIDYSGGFSVGKLADFSSYGPDDRGNVKPEVCAPGAFLISSISAYDNRYSETGSNRFQVASEETVNGRLQRYGLMFGTSMSAPHCAGIIATWLQANPMLTPKDIKNILIDSSTVDSDVTNDGGTEKWGAGKINAYKGMKEVLESSSIDGAIMDADVPLLIYPNPSNGNFEIIIPNEVGEVVVNVFGLNGSLVATREYSIKNGNIINVNLGGVLSVGMYVLQVKGNNTLSTTRLVIR